MKLTIKVVSLLTLMITVLMVPAVIVIWHNQQQSIIEQARIRAITLYQMIVVTRQWVAENTERIEPVPAQATKELSNFANYMADFRFHITSDQLINEENFPDDFELRAIEVLKTGATEYSERGKVEDLGRVYRYAAPLLINESCLPCHGYQGYQIDEFRGLISVMIPLYDLEEAIKSSNNALLATIFVGLSGVIIIVSLLLYRLVLRPLNILTEAAGHIRRGNYDMKTAIKTDDEIQELSEAFDMMSTQIAQNEETLKSSLDEAVQKYVNLVDELKDTNEKLGSLNQLKTDLLDFIAHEIRTPLTKIMSYSELMVDPRLSDDTDARERFGNALKRNIASMTAMFNDIITLSRLEHGQHPYHKIPVVIREIVENTVENYEKEITEKNLKVDVNIPARQYLLVDGESFRAVLSNIISNAVKYSHKDGHILIKTEVYAENITLVCRDEGIGIPRQDIDKVLFRFQRGSNVKKEYAGTGLGLAIVSRVVKAHGGELDIHSELGKYTEIRVTIPLRNDLA